MGLFNFLYTEMHLMSSFECFHLSLILKLYLFIIISGFFHKSHLLKLRVAPSETAMTDVLREVCAQQSIIMFYV